MLLKILRAAIDFFDDDIEWDTGYVPNSLPNGSPCNPSITYIRIGPVFNDLAEKDEQELIKLGWKKESEGEFWVYYS